MLLNEILSKSHPGIKGSSIPMSRFRNLEYYTPKKWNDVGKGQQTRAFANDTHPGKIIKVTMAYNNEEDPAYQFLRLCLNHQDNPFFPKIYNIKKYPSGDETALVISMEKLIPLTNQDFNHLQQLMDIPFVPERDNQEAIAGGLHHSFTKPGVRQYIMKNTKNPELKQSMRLLEPLFRHYGPDMHMGNIMKRANNHIVFIDPITYEIFD